MEKDNARIYNAVYNSHKKYIEQHPYVDDEGIYVPIHPYALEGTASDYRLLMTKDMFIEAYNKWIKGE